MNGGATTRNPDGGFSVGGSGGAAPIFDGGSGLRDASLDGAMPADGSTGAGGRGNGGTGSGGRANGGTSGAAGHAGKGGTAGHAGQNGAGGAPKMCGNIFCDCTLKGIKLWGTVRVETDLSASVDFEVSVVDAFEDLDVEKTSFPDACGQWDMTATDFEDFSVRLNASDFPDFTIQYSDFPGIPGQ